MALALVLLAGSAVAFGQTAQAPEISFIQTLFFAHQGTGGATAPPAQTVRVFTVPSNIQFTATATTQSGGGWLLVNGALQATVTAGTSGGDLTVSVVPTLPAGTYTGTVTITSGSTTRAISVTLVVTANPVARLNPGSVFTTVEAGQTATIPVNVTSTGAAMPWAAEVVAASPGANWLLVGPNTGQTGSAATVFINTANLPASAPLGIGSIRFTSGGSQVTLPVAVAVAPASQLVPTPTTVIFPYQIGQAAPTTRSVSVTSSTQSQITYTATIITSSPWLSLSTTAAGPGSSAVTATTPSTLYLIPNLSTVPATPATLEATVRLTSSTGSTQDVTARLVVSTQPQLVLGQNAVPFAYTLGGTTPASQTFQVGTTSGTQAYTATPEYTNDRRFFTVSPQQGFTPSPLTVALDTTVLAGLAAGTYTGNIKISTASGATENVPVTLTVSGSALITVSPLQPDPFQGTIGAPQTERTLQVTSTDGTNQAFSVTVEYTGTTTGWLSVSPFSGTTGISGLIRYNVTPSAVTAAGTYEANIVITPTGVTGAPAVRVPIRYIVSASQSVTASPARLELTQTGTTAPAEQTISLTGPNVTYFVRATQPWIRVTQVGDSIPGSVRVTFDTSSLQPGEHAGEIVITPSGLPEVRIPVTLTLQSAARLNVTPTSLTFAATPGGAAPAAQNLSLTSSGAAISFTAAATTDSGGNWLSVTPASGTTGASGAAATALRVSVDPTGLAVGTYRGNVRITAAAASNSPVNVAVTLNVAAPSAPAGLVISNSATGASRGVSPGQIITVKGRNMAPSTGMEARVVNNMVQTQLGEVTVEFDAIAAPLTYVGPSGDRQSDQINAVVPYQIAGRITTRMVVSYRGVRSEAIELRVLESDPGIFTASQTGSGQGAILNQNNSVNSMNNPAARGSVIQIFATGEGQVTPAGTTGQVIQGANDLRRPLGVVTARINGQPATVEYSGSAPTLVSGVLQVNVRIPQNLNITAPTSVPVEIQVGNQSSQAGVTVAVRP
jgi:uncharacterized protein (TIGR03437 family)